jgi:hypothetical protein
MSLFKATYERRLDRVLLAFQEAVGRELVFMYFR